jgi:23S rRNA (guanosine2251-2'-O)-methyltransferase
VARHRSRRDGRRGDLVPISGRRAVAEAIRSGAARRVLVAEAAHGTQGLRALLDAAAEAGVDVERVDPSALESLGLRDHQGVAAQVALPEEVGDHGFGSTTFGPDALVVVLDGVTDPQNFGACARSAEAAGAAMLVARRDRAAPLTPAALRASSGALFSLLVARVTNLSRALGHLHEVGFTVVGLDHLAAVDLHHAPGPARPMALVVGAEDVGLSRLVRESCDLLLSIPMTGRVGSLNASAALSVALFGYALRPG